MRQIKRFKMANKWIQEAHLKEGAFTKWAKRHGYSVENGMTSEAIAAGKASDDESVRKMATLAQTFKRIATRRERNQ